MAQITVNATIDSVMNQKQPNTNYGANVACSHQVTYDVTGKNGWFRAIANFDLSAIAGATVTAAKLLRQIYSITNGGLDAQVQRCTRPDQWTEGGVTWNTYNGINPWTDAGGDRSEDDPPRIEYTEPSSAGLHELTGLIDFAQDALDNRNNIVSIITSLVDEDPGVTTQYLWRSREHGADIWRLVVDYIPAGTVFTQPRRSATIEPPHSASGPTTRPSRPARPARPTSPTRPHRTPVLR